MQISKGFEEPLEIVGGPWCGTPAKVTKSFAHLECQKDNKWRITSVSGDGVVHITLSINGPYYRFFAGPNGFVLGYRDR